MPFALPWIEVPGQDLFSVLERTKEPLGSRGGKGFAAAPSLAHDLRRPFGTWYSQQNPDKVRELAQLMGHSDLPQLMKRASPTKSVREPGWRGCKDSSFLCPASAGPA